MSDKPETSVPIVANAYTTNAYTLNEPPLTLDEIRKAVSERHQLAGAALARMRREREQLNERIRGEVAEEAEAARILRALEPRKAAKP